MPLLEVENLHVSIGDTDILRGVNFSVERGQTLGVVGESGCGKSMTGLAIMGMLPYGGRYTKGSIRLDGQEITSMSQKTLRTIRGTSMALVMQDPFTSLNPLMKVGDQIAEVLVMHKGASWKSAREQAIVMMDKVGIPSPEASSHRYPHQLSGGQRQRVVIAIAFAARPKLLIADEPTTALDVTIQAQILRLLKSMQAEDDTAVILISHDLGIIAGVADDIGVYYAGRVVEHGKTETVLRQPKHPYTESLLKAIPTVGKERLDVIQGQPPLLANLPEGCPFRPRCAYAFDQCIKEPPLMPTDVGSEAGCWLVASPAATGTAADQ